MPIILTAPTGDTLTLDEEGGWSGTDETLLDIAENTTLSIDDQFKSDPILELAKTVQRAVPGMTLEERGRPPLEELPDGAVP